LEENSISIVVSRSGIVVESEISSIITRINERSAAGSGVGSRSRNCLLEDELLKAHSWYCEEVLGANCGEYC